MSVELGDKVKDRVSGLVGIAVARSDYLFQCRQIAIQPQELHEGKPLKAEWFDEESVEVVKKAVIQVAPLVRADVSQSRAWSGGPERTHGKDR